MAPDVLGGAGTRHNKRGISSQFRPLNPLNQLPVFETRTRITPKVEYSDTFERVFLRGIEDPARLHTLFVDRKFAMEKEYSESNGRDFNCRYVC